MKQVNLNSNDIRFLNEPLNVENGIFVGSSCDDSHGIGCLIVCNLKDVIEIGRNNEFDADDDNGLYVVVLEEQEPSIAERSRGIEKLAPEKFTYYLFDFQIIK